MINIGEAITLDDGREYLCFEQIGLNDKLYLCLITTDEPNVVRLAEQIGSGDDIQIRLIGEKAEKQRILSALKDKLSSRQQ